MKTQYPGIVAMVAAILASASIAAAPDGRPQQPPASPQQLFEAGQYDQTLASIAEMRSKGPTGLPDAFLASQAALKLNQNDRAKEEFARLTASDDPIWRLVGESSIAGVDNDRDRSVELAAKAADEAKNAPGSPDDPARKLREFHVLYSLGLARTRREEWPAAAESLARATDLNPTFAYAHYYAGLAYSHVKRPDLVSKHLEMFLKLAPKAPERSAVTSLLRSIRGD